MDKSRFNILVVEDDPTQGKALEEAFSRAGYNSVWAQSSVSALTQAQRIEFHCLIVDCMLPRMNGVDLVEEIFGMSPKHPKVFMFTGIFKDRKFIKEAMNRTHAETFFIKPLDLESVLSHVEKALSDSEVPDAPTILEIYGEPLLSDQELIRLVEKESTLHAFHLPMVYQRFLASTLTGDLTLTFTGGDVCSVGFFNGKICAVKTPDKESFFGSLAVEHGFVSPEDVIAALKSPERKRLGEKLINSFSLSPHAIDVILEEQLALRLSQTIRDDVISISWETAPMAEPVFCLLAKRFNHLIEDWLSSKLTFDWMKTTLMLWGRFQLLGHYHSRIDGEFTIEEVFSNPQFRERNDLWFMFENLVKRDAFIGSMGEPTQDFSFLESRLDQMEIDFKTQNYFQLLGLNEKAHSREISRAYEGLREAFDPANLPDSCPSDLMEKCKRVFAVIEKAKKTLSDDMDRLRYIQMLQSRRGQEVLASEPIFRTAVMEILNGNYEAAGKKFQALIDRKMEFKDLRAFRIWAGLKTNRGFSGLRMDQIPPEERHSPVYMMARGVYYRGKGQYRKALDSFRKAVVLDSRLAIAKQEIKGMLKELDGRSSNTDLIKDVTSVVEGLFKKSRRGA